MMRRKNKKRGICDKTNWIQKEKMIQTDRLATHRLDFENEKLTNEKLKKEEI